MNSILKNDVLSANMRLLEAIATNDFDSYRNLCANEMFSEVDDNNNDKNECTRKIMAIQEGEENDLFAEIKTKCAEMTFITKEGICKLRSNVGFGYYFSRDEDLVTPRNKRMENGALFPGELLLAKASTG